MRLADLADLPPTLSTEQAAQVFGVGVDHLWALARAGTAPVEPVRLGRRLRWPTTLVMRSVGVDVTDESPSASVVQLREVTG
jgi:predicted DNA-binding transcriptional regulator AlpA